MNIGLILSGGMAKGAYQIGALKALKTFIPFNEIKYISGASIGVLNGYAYATDTLEYAEKSWFNLCEDNSRFLISHVLKSSMLKHNISNLYNPERLPRANFYCSLFEWNRKNIVYKNISKVEPNLIPRYLKASVSMPVYNRSVKIDDCCYFDGAMIDNIPVFPLLKHNLDYMICIYFDDVCYQFENPYFDNRILKVTFPSENIIKQSILFERDSIEAMINDGYSKTVELFNSIFANGYQDLTHIYQSIDHMNREKKRCIRITGDMLVTNLNKITQKLTKREVL